MTQVWILVEPGDYQRASILGVYAKEADAQRDMHTERENLRASGDMNWNYVHVQEHTVCS